jgi:glutaredoxin
VTEESRPPTIQHIILFVCSGCEACRQATTYLRGWANGCTDVFVEIISILDQPEQVIRLGISQTPALVMDGKVLAQNFTVDELARLLLNQPGDDETGL